MSSMPCAALPRGFGYVPPDCALPTLRQPATDRVGPVRDEVSFASLCPAAAVQGDRGTCVAHAAVAAFHVLDRRAGRRGPLDSAFALYHAVRRARGLVGEDPGCSLAELLDAARREDLYDTGAWPNEPAFFHAPPLDARPRTPPRRLVSYEALPLDAALLQWTLAAGIPVLAGLKTFEGWLDASTRRSGHVVPPVRGEDYRGGHAVLLTGYSRSARVYRFLNSWGPEFGARGHGTLAFAYVHDPMLCLELQAVRALRTWP